MINTLKVVYFVFVKPPCMTLVYNKKAYFTFLKKTNILHILLLTLLKWKYDVMHWYIGFPISKLLSE